MQLRHRSPLDCCAYVNQKEWERATLDACPSHPGGGCSFRRNGHYSRDTRCCGTLKVARYYCPESHRTFSLLPDFMAARTPGTLRQFECAAAAMEQGATALEAARETRPGYPVCDNGMRAWARRRQRAVACCLALLASLLADPAGCALTVLDVRERLGAECALEAARGVFDANGTLRQSPHPAGFLPPCPAGFLPP